MTISDCSISVAYTLHVVHLDNNYYIDNCLSIKKGDSFEKIERTAICQMMKRSDDNESFSSLKCMGGLRGHH